MPFPLHFFGVGPQRTGTTWLDAHLRHHPQLSFPQDVKETRFFDLYYDKGLEWYGSHFHAEGAGKFYGEIAPTYFNHAAIPARIHEMNPGTKIIVNLRDPVSRVFSLYRHHVFRGHAQGAFSDVVSGESHLIDSGRYARYIPQWLDRFGEAVLFILFDDIVASPGDTLKRVWSFLNVKEIAAPESIAEKKGAMSPPRSRLLAKGGVKLANALRRYRLHKLVEIVKAIGLNQFILGGGKEDVPELTPGEKRWVLEQHESDIRYVESLLGRDLAKWRQV